MKSTFTRIEMDCIVDALKIAEKSQPIIVSALNKAEALAEVLRIKEALDAAKKDYYEALPF